MLMNDLEIPREFRWGSVPFAGEGLLDDGSMAPPDLEPGESEHEGTQSGASVSWTACLGSNEGMASGLTVPAQWCIGWFNIRFRETKAVSA